MYRQLLPKILRKISRSALSIATAVLLLAGLYGCGNKGDLYLPEDTATTFGNTTDTLANQQ
jgi:predicted small lipoprotein YifL